MVPSVLTEMKKYVGFGHADAAVLAELGPVLRPSFGSVVDAFYAAIEGHPGASRAITGGEAQVRRLKGTLVDWLEGLVGGVYDEAYYERRARIGRVHVRIELDQRYMFGAMNLIRQGLHEALGASDWPRERLREAHVAIDRILDIELAIMLETYREAYGERIRATERIEHERRTARAEALATMGELTAGLAHEIRNPLNAAKLQLEVLSRSAGKVREPGLAATIRERARIVQQEIARLATMLDEFLILARPRVLESEAFDIVGLIEEVQALEQPVADQEGIRIEAVPPHDARHRARGDRAKVKQVLVNLIANAIEAIRGTGDVGSIRIETELLGDGFVAISVIDSGPGISEVARERVFEPFYTTKDAGTGLGLSVAKRIVEMHGGTISIDAHEEGGTVARFTLRHAG